MSRARILDTRHCVYRYYDAGGRLLYVGLSADPHARFAAHRKTAWAAECARIELHWLPSRSAARAAEKHAIRMEAPAYNVKDVPRLEPLNPDETRDQFNVRITRRHQRLVKMHAGSMGLRPSKMLERMIEFYDQHAGEL